LEINIIIWELLILGVRVLRFTRKLSINLECQRALESLPYEVRRQAEEAAGVAIYPRASKDAQLQ